MKGRRGKTCRIGVVLVIFIITSGIFIYNYTDQKGSNIHELVSRWVPGAETITADTSQDFNEEQIPEEIDLPNPTVTIAAAGDVMMHDGQIWAGYDDVADTFDYSEFFHVVKDEISSADLAMADLETTLAGKEQKYTGYPMFNSPDELADALKDAGFDVIITSNNHSLDRGAKGALRTLKVLKERGLSTIGTYESEEDRQQILIKDINNMKVAFLSYTYGTNGIPIPSDRPYLVNLIDEDVILEDLARARELADAVIVYLHFGNEYQRTPSKEQRNLAHLVLKNGANIIVASHPHVIQPGEWMEVEDSDGEIVKKYTAYSMGNFISAQRFPHTEEGLIVKFTLEKDLERNKVYLTDVKEIDTWVDKFVRNGKMRYVVRFGKKP
ncbi:MAG: CapA family protein [Tepidanaerobacteraceae bacterium]|nr:CapA family protein [Tepidanaerobacteraceae bacterium]